MKFIIDAHLPIVLKKWLIDLGHNVIHTRDLPKKNLTGDVEIIRIADSEDRIVISKDSDFQKHRVLFGSPKRILMITTGNIANDVLLNLFQNNFSLIIEGFEKGNQLIELSNDAIVIHE